MTRQEKMEEMIGTLMTDAKMTPLELPVFIAMAKDRCCMCHKFLAPIGSTELQLSYFQRGNFCSSCNNLSSRIKAKNKKKKSEEPEHTVESFLAMFQKRQTQKVCSPS